MKAADVFAVLHALELGGVTYWVDGGWGIDALLGEETRPHSDLDLIVARSQMDRARSVLEGLGFVHAGDVRPGLPARDVWRAEPDRQVDLHLVIMDAAGNGWQELDDGAWGLYPSDGLRGTGRIDGHPVPCLTAELQLRHHLGFAWDAEHVEDMRWLARRFGLPLPPVS